MPDQSNSVQLPPGFRLVDPAAQGRAQAASVTPPPGFTLQTPPNGQQATPDAQDGFFSRVWKGLLGGDASRAGRFGMGLADPEVGMVQLGARAPIGEAVAWTPEQTLQQPDPKAVDQVVQQREQRYQQSEKAAGLKGDMSSEWARLLGNAASPVSVGLGAAGGAAAPAGMAGRLAVGALTGAAGGLTDPASDAKEDFWTQKGRQAALGAAGGAAGTAVGSTVGRALAPRLTGDAAALAGEGVQLSPAQMVPGKALGRAARAAEDKLTSFPILGDFINNVREHNISSFNRATINQALEPIGASLPKGVAVGNDAVRVSGNAISQAYDSILSRVPHVAYDQDLRSELRNIAAQAGQRRDVARDLKSTTENLFVGKMKAGPMTGREVHRAASELGRQARDLLSSEDSFRRELGRHLNEVRSALMDTIERQYPNVAPDLRSANAAWAMQVRIENAAVRRAGSEGVFTPMDLLQAVKSGSGGVRRREFARGDALMQDWAQSANNVLPSRVPDSGTAGRLNILNLPLGAAGLAAGLPYRAAGSAFRSQPPPLVSGAADAARTLGVAASPAAGQASARRRPPPDPPDFPWAPVNR